MSRHDVEQLEGIIMEVFAVAAEHLGDPTAFQTAANSLAAAIDQFVDAKLAQALGTDHGR